MTHPSVHAARRPDHPAVVMASTGARVNYAELDTASIRLARLLRRRGLEPGGHIAVLLENHERCFEVAWAAQRSGLYYTFVNRHLRQDEVAYIVNDCGAEVLITSHAQGELARAVAGTTPGVRVRLAMDGSVPGHEPYEDLIASVTDEPLADETEGGDMLYTSGTTGRPKGVKRPLSGRRPEEPSAMLERLSDANGLGQDTVLLCTAPLYHAGPLGYAMRVHRRGGTVVVMERFDPREALRLIERHGVTHSQWVPTMFVRLLRLPEGERSRYDLSTLRSAVHSAGPCPPAVKRAMIEWWGPVLEEFYGGTERNGLTHLDSKEWLRHPGSVGKPIIGRVHVLSDDGSELPPGGIGTIYFSGGPSFEYHGDPEKTGAARSPQGWTTLGDIGWVDDDGYLYLTDRRDFTIITGGVNVYPREIEDVLLEHPHVKDAAVFGLPDPEYGERIHAVVAALEPQADHVRLDDQLMAHCRSRLASFKCPRSVEVRAELPRDPSGKLRKRELRDECVAAGRF